MAGGHRRVLLDVGKTQAVVATSNQQDCRFSVAAFPLFSKHYRKKKIDINNTIEPYTIINR